MFFVKIHLFVTINDENFSKIFLKELGRKISFFKKNAIHLHVHAGATPKDGPSAGITLATALVSALSERRAKGTVAMTGEISLRGRILPVGGIKAKLLAAARAGVQTVVMPRRNEKDLVEIPDEVLEKLDVRLVETIQDALEIALETPR